MFKISYEWILFVIEQLLSSGYFLHILYLPPHHKIDMIETLDVRYDHLEELIHLQQQHQMVVVELLSIIRHTIQLH